MSELYHGLDLSIDTIRLFTIRDGDASSPIQCDLKVISRETCQNDYVALSYCWGDPSDKDTIFVNDRPLDVPRNLVAYLRKARIESDEETPRKPLWADSICIDQANLDERSREVWKMKRIYEDAGQVMLWLGPEADDSDLAGQLIIRTLEHFYEHIDDFYQNLQHIQEDPSMQKCMVLIGKAVLGLDESNPDEHPDLERDWKALICLLKRSWWMRTWIMQEATTANETMMAWGNTTIPFQMVLSCISMITGTMSFFLCDSDLLSGYETSLPPFVNEVFTYMDKGPMIITRISESREQLTTASSPLSILKMVQMFRPCGASDNRDKIFAPLSLFENPHLPNFVIDYNVSEKAVYQRFAESLILATNPPNLDVLGFCWTHEEKEGQESPSLPSWVPDWTKPSPHALERLPKRLPEFDDIRIGERVAYAADSVLRRMAGAEQNLRVQLVDGLLQAHGLLLAQLEDIRPPFGNNSAYEDSLFDDAETRMYTPTGTTLHEASLMTSSCGLSYKEGVFDRSDPVNWNELDLRTLLDFSDKRASGVAEVKVPDILYFSHAFGRCLASTNRGFIALVPSNARVGDQLYILYGGQVVYCLRKDGTMHTSVGECYVHGIMDGEFIGYLGIDGSTIVMDKVTIK